MSDCISASYACYVHIAILFDFQDDGGESEKGAGAEAETESEMVAKEDNKGMEIWKYWLSRWGLNYI